jgi:hypothetical protein
MQLKPLAQNFALHGNFPIQSKSNFTMEIIIGLALFSAGIALTSHLYCQLARPYRSPCEVASLRHIDE